MSKQKGYWYFCRAVRKWGVKPWVVESVEGNWLEIRLETCMGQTEGVL